MYLRDTPKVLTAHLKQRLTCELVGPPGVGKTEVFHQWTKAMSVTLGEPVGLLVFHLTTAEPYDLNGFLVWEKTMENGKEVTISKYTRPPLMPSEAIFPEGIPRIGIVLLDEARQAEHDVSKAAARFMNEGRLGEYDLRDYGHWVPMLASNRVEDQSGVNKELRFITNRKCEYHIQPHLPSWMDWAYENNIHGTIISFAQTHTGVMFSDKVPQDDGPYPTPRSVVRCGSMLQEFAGAGEELATDVVGAECAAGYLGEAAAATLMKHLRQAGELPTIEEIVRSPSTCKVPKMDRPDALYTVTQTCVTNVTNDNAVAVFEYLTRLPGEFQMSGIHQAHKRAKAIVQTAEFGEWISKNNDLIMKVARYATENRL